MVNVLGLGQIFESMAEVSGSRPLYPVMVNTFCTEALTRPESFSVKNLSNVYPTVMLSNFKKEAFSR
jgi:hypothetical protein